MTFFTFSVVIGMGIKWETALGAVFWSGVVFIILSVFNIRTYIVRAIPRQIRYAVAAGIGLFIALIGFVNGHLVVANPSTLVTIAEMDAVRITFVVGLFITAVLIVKNVKGALIVGIVIITLLAIPIGRLYGDASSVNNGISTLVTWKGIFAEPDLI